MPEDEDEEDKAKSPRRDHSWTSPGPTTGEDVVKPEHLEQAINVPHLFWKETRVDRTNDTESYESLALGKYYTFERYRRMPDGSRAITEKTSAGPTKRKDAKYYEDGEKIVDARSWGENFIRVYYQRSDRSRFYEHKKYVLYEDKATVLDHDTGEHSRTIDFASSYVRRYWDAGDGNKVLTGKKTLLDSKFLIARNDGKDHVKVKRLGGLINRTYVSGDSTEVAAKGLDATEGRTIKRRVGFYRMEIGKNDERQETTNHRIGKGGKLFSQTKWLDSDGRTVSQTTVLGNTFFKRSPTPGGDEKGPRPLKTSMAGRAYSPTGVALAANRSDSDIVSREVANETAPTLTRSRSLREVRTVGSLRRLQEWSAQAAIGPTKGQVTARNTPGKQNVASALEEAPADQSPASSARSHSALPKPALPAGWQASGAVNRGDTNEATRPTVPPEVQAKSLLTSPASKPTRQVLGEATDVPRPQLSPAESARENMQSSFLPSETPAEEYGVPDDDEMEALLAEAEMIRATARASVETPAPRGRSASPAAGKLPRQMDDRLRRHDGGVSI